MANSSKPVRHFAQSSWHEPAPYVGPRPFTRDDQDIFFGRNQEALELTSLIKAHPEVLLYAQSGAGKTSLLYAQVMPILDRDEEFDVLPSARVRSQESLAIPDDKINNIYMFNALRDLSHDKLSLLERAQFTLAEYLTGQPRSLAKLTDSAAEHPTEENTRRLPRVIIFDQFEEIFTLYPERYKDRQDFFSQVSDALEADQFLRVVFSMREDYIAELDPYIDLMPEKLRTRFRLERLRKANALSAVKKPLETSRFKKTGRQFAPGAAESLVDRLMLIKVKTASGEKIEVLGEFVDPVQLQVVCQTLWEKLPPDDVMISVEDLDKYANVEEALLDFYENSVRKAVAAAKAVIETKKPTPTGALSMITEGAVRGWFDQVLITREGKRNMVFREREMTGGLSNVVVDELENQHLVRVEMRSGEPWYELSHDRFIPPIRESNRRWLFQQPLAQRKAQELEARANKWLNAHRDRSLLLDRGELVDAQNWLRSPEAAAIGYSETLYSLVRDSEVAVEHEDNERQRILAAEQQRRVIAEQARARQLKIGFVIASLLLLFALGSAVRAYRAENRATNNYQNAQSALMQAKAAQIQEEKARNEAESAADEARTAARNLAIARDNESTARRKADEARKRAEADRALAVSARTAAEREKEKADAALRETKEVNIRLERSKARAWSYKLAADSNLQLSIDPELALRLAIEAVNFGDTPQAKYSLRQAYIKSKERSILRGHTDIVWQAAYSPDGQFIFTASEDGTVKVWDVKTNRELKTFEGNEDGVHAISISPDGTHIATEANAKGRLWRVSDGTSIVLDGLTGPVAAIAFSPNGKLVATEATSDNEDEKKAGAAPRIWDVDSKTIRQTLLGHERAISALAFSPNSDLLATASWDSTARIWDVATGRELTVLRGHTAPLDSVAFDPTGRFLVTGSYDGTARVWDVKTGQERIVLRGHTGGVRAVAYSPNGALILTVGQRVTAFTANNNQIPLPPGMPTDDAAPIDNTVRVWDAKGGTPVTVIRDRKSEIEINLAIFSPDSKMIATAAKDGTVRVREAATDQDIAKFLGHSDSNVNSLAFSRDGKFVLTAGDDHTTQVWTVMNSANARRLGNRSLGQIQRVQFNSNGDTIVSASSSGSVRFMKPTGELMPGGLTPVAGSEQVYDVAVSPNYKFAVTASRRAPRTRAPSRVVDLDAQVWDLESKRLVKVLKHQSRVTKVEYSPKGTYVLTVSIDGTARVWETANWTTVVKLEPSEVKAVEASSSILAAAFDPTEEYVATAESTGYVAVWEILTGVRKRVFSANDKDVTSVAFNGKGDLLVTTSPDATARVWTIYGKNVSTLTGHDGDVLSAEFSQDGDFIVTAGIDGTVRLWNALTGDPFTAVKIHGYPILRASFSPDGKSVAIGDGQGFLYVLDCELCRPFDDIKRMAGELKPRKLTPDEWSHFVPDDQPKAATQ